MQVVQRVGVAAAAIVSESETVSVCRVSEVSTRSQRGLKCLPVVDREASQLGREEGRRGKSEGDEERRAG